nr:hypothetical protein [Pseudomonas cichorii]
MSETIESLKRENDRLRKHILQYQIIEEVPLLKNYRPYSERQKPSQLELDAAIDLLRMMGASIDGDNAYKRDLLDTAVGAMCCGKQNNNPPPAGHWGERFWDIGRAEGQQRDELVAALKPLLAHWDDLKPGESLNVDAARVAIAKATA